MTLIGYKYSMLKNLFRATAAHDGVRRYGFNMSWLLLEKVFRMAVGFTVGVYVARKLGPDNFGILNYAISFAAIFSILVNLGLDQILIRELVKRPRRRNAIMGTAFGLQATGFCLMMILVIISLYFTSGDMNTKLIVLIISGGYLFQIFQTIDLYFQSEVLSKYVAISQIITWSVISLLRFLCAWGEVPLIYFAWLEAGNMIFTAVCYVAFYFMKRGSPAKWQFQPHLAVFLLKNSWPLMLTGMAYIICIRIDQVLLKLLADNNAVGNYAVAVRLVELFYFIPMVIKISFFPAIINAKKISPMHYMHRMQQFYILMVWTGIFISLSFGLSGRFIIHVLYGAKYAAAGDIIHLYAWLIFFVCIGIAAGCWTISENLTVYILCCNLGLAAINFTLVYLFIPIMGIKGAVWGMLIAQVVGAFIFPLFSGKTRQTLVFFIKSLYPVPLLREIILKKAKFPA